MDSKLIIQSGKAGNEWCLNIVGSGINVIFMMFLNAKCYMYKCESNLQVMAGSVLSAHWGTVLIMNSEDQLKTTFTLGVVSRILLFGETERWGKIQQEADEDKRRMRWRRDNLLSQLSHAFSFVLPLPLFLCLFLSLLDLSQVICFSSSRCPRVLFQYNMLILIYCI